MAEHNQQFDSFQQWVNKATSWLTRRGASQRAVCVDAKGRVCQIGAHFMRARDEGAFPVRWIWPDDEPAPVLKHPGHDEMAAFAREIIGYASDGNDADGGSIQALAVAHGLLVETKYDPAIHGPSMEAKPGDAWYVLSGPLAGARV